MKKHCCIGILAHVDAGKTTLSEAMLYHAGSLRAMGRVDHQDAFLDAHPLERARGITIFSDQAMFHLGDTEFYLVDTPGHADFSAEMERAMAVMDYAVLVVSCAEGVQSHTGTVWQLLRRSHVPTFLFLNKTDRAGADPDRVLGELRRKLSPDCAPAEELTEAAAERDEALLEAFLNDTATPQQTDETARRLIREEKL
ncbi:MAG: GTP-binding protein, partial [Candidatus Spyradocola sp.]